MGILLRLFLTLVSFFLAAIFEGGPLRYVFAVVGFLIFRGIFERPKQPAEQPHERSPSEAHIEGDSSGDQPVALFAGDELEEEDRSNAIPVSDGDFVEIEPTPADQNESLSAPSSALARYEQMGWAIGCFGFLALVAIGVGYVKTSREELASVDPFEEADEFQKAEEPSLASRLLPDAWDQSACLEQRFPILRMAPEMLSPEMTSQVGWQRGEYLAGVSCAFDWNDDQVARQVGILRSHGLLMIQWNAETMAQMRKMLEDRENLPPEIAALTPDKLPEDLYDVGDPQFANLARLTEGLTMAVMEPELPAPAPDVKSRARARAELDISKAPVPLRAGPRTILINELSPRISLYTDMPDTMTLADLGSEAGIVMGGAFKTYHERLDLPDGNGLPTLSLAPDLFSRFLIGQLRAIVANEVRHRPEGLPSLPDLEILYLKRPIPPEVLGQSVRRAGLYREDLGIVYVQRQSSVAYKEGVDDIMSILSADFLHELDHYFRGSPRNEGHPFLLEGQATFDGEEGMRPVLAAARYKSQSTLQEVIASLDLPLEQFEELAAKRIAKEGMSLNQRRILCHALGLIKSDQFDLEKLLTVSAPRLAQMDDDFHRDFYSSAWAAYGALHQDHAWPERFRYLAATALKSGLTPELRQELGSLQARTIEWASSESRKENLSCPM